MNARVALRAAALLIATTSLIDPAVSRTRPRPQVVTVVAVDEASVEAASRIADKLGAYATAAVRRYRNTSTAAACPASGACILASSSAVPARVSAGARLLGIVRTTGAARVVARVDAPSFVHRDAAATLRVHTTRPVERVEVFDGNALVGFAESEGETSIDVSWVPVADGARALRVVTGDDRADAGVIVSTAPAPVFFYEPQATWLGTFVRRALENDPRFELRGRTRLAPPVAVARGEAGALNANTVQDVGVVVVTAPELLTLAEVDLLERFVANRGGSLLVASDRRPDGAVRRLLPRVVGEHREPEPRTIGPLRATEWVTFDSSAVGTSTVAAIDEQPVVVARALGRGRVIVSGALDAWRFRHAAQSFDTFWTALAWDASVMAGSRLRLVTDRVIARPGEPIEVDAELQSLDSGPALGELQAAGHVQCGSRRFMLRMWPGARYGVFRGVLRGEFQGACEIAVTVGNATATTPVTIGDDVNGVMDSAARLDAIAAAHGVPLVTVPAEDELLKDIRAQEVDDMEQVTLRPMRSPFWLVPFVACLGGEWWLRRRSGVS